MRARQTSCTRPDCSKGRLGFSKAILLVEDAVEQFSNSQGFAYVKFEKGRIRAAFDEVRAILEREGIVQTV